MYKWWIRCCKIELWKSIWCFLIDDEIEVVPTNTEDGTLKE